VSLNEAWKLAPQESEIKLKIKIDSAANRPDRLNGRMAITIQASCEPQITPSSDATAVVNPDEKEAPVTDPTVIPAELPEPQPEEDICAGSNQHPTGIKLAQRYDVSYAEIMNWHCGQHFGFGEIDLGYSLSRSSGMAVDEVFAMRSNGMSWGAIKQQLQSEKENKPSSPDKKGKDKKDK
jgi:hypothetical protein